MQRRRKRHKKLKEVKNFINLRSADKSFQEMISIKANNLEPIHENTLEESFQQKTEWFFHFNYYHKPYISKWQKSNDIINFRI